MGTSRSAYYDAPTGAPDDTAVVEAMSAMNWTPFVGPRDVGFKV